MKIAAKLSFLVVCAAWLPAQAPPPRGGGHGGFGPRFPTYSVERPLGQKEVGAAGGQVRVVLQCLLYLALPFNRQFVVYILEQGRIR